MKQAINGKRVRRSNEQVRNLLDEFRKGGVSVKEFCVMHNISRAAFHKWQVRYKNKTDQPMKPAGFADLHIIPSEMQTALFAEVNGPKDYQVKIYRSVPASYLKELLG